jgi:thiamine-monophosphate kinase
VLTGGEDHGLAATFPSDRELPPHWQLVGRVIAGGEAGVLVDGAPYTGDVAAFDHFGKRG